MKDSVLSYVYQVFPYEELFRLILTSSKLYQLCCQVKKHSYAFTVVRNQQTKTNILTF